MMQWADRTVKKDLVGPYLKYKGKVYRPVGRTKHKVEDRVNPDKVPSTGMIKVFNKKNSFYSLNIINPIGY